MMYVSVMVVISLKAPDKKSSVRGLWQDFRYIFTFFQLLVVVGIELEVNVVLLLLGYHRIANGLSWAV